MGKPDFYGIGAQKAGTSRLYVNLNNLPDIQLLPFKEVHYFDREDKYPSRSYLNKTDLTQRLSKNYLAEMIHTLIKTKRLRDLKFYWKWYFKSYNYELYESFFNDLDGISGEITPSYSFLDVQDINRMYEINPKAKLILMLRDPIARAWSQYRYDNRLKRDFNFKDIRINSVIDLVNSKGQILRSDYELTIENYTSVFPKGQLIIGFFDALKDYPEHLLLDIVHFLGMNTDQNYLNKYCELKRKVNVATDLDMPEEVMDYFKVFYETPIKRLSSKYGGYFEVWKKILLWNKSHSRSDKLKANHHIMNLPVNR